MAMRRMLGNSDMPEWVVVVILVSRTTFRRERVAELRRLRRRLRDVAADVPLAGFRGADPPVTASPGGMTRRGVAFPRDVSPNGVARRARVVSFRPRAHATASAPARAAALAPAGAGRLIRLDERRARGAIAKGDPGHAWPI